MARNGRTRYDEWRHGDGIRGRRDAWLKNGGRPTCLRTVHRIHLTLKQRGAATEAHYYIEPSKTTTPTPMPRRPNTNAEWYDDYEVKPSKI